MIISCLYKPPTGNVIKVCDFLKSLYTNLKHEIWLLGDFNVDFLNQTSDSRLKFINIFRTYGLKQLIDKYTRPNKHGGTCIDWLVTDSDYVCKYGVCDVFISDHLPIYCTRKKKREKHRMCRDMSNFDVKIVSNLLKNIDRVNFDTTNDPNLMWNILYEKTIDILAIMCPFKKYRQREKISPWIQLKFIGL